MQKFLTHSQRKRILADMKPLNVLLQEWRDTLRISDAEAARRCDMTRQQWFEVISGRTRDPRASTIDRLANGTGYAVDLLVEASKLTPADLTPRREAVPAT